MTTITNNKGPWESGGNLQKNSCCYESAVIQSRYISVSGLGVKSILAKIACVLCCLLKFALLPCSLKHN